jgi:23S rRNA pseudouridine2605 synthase
MKGHFPHRTDEADAGQGDRVAKVLARAGVASRREVERLIGAGRVALNGQVLMTPAVKVGDGDILTVDGEVVGEAEPTRLFRYHKPTGLVTTHRDPKGRKTVFDALPQGLPRLISVGRLDINSEGLLLLTNDGALARALELPANAWVRRYRARARGRVDQARLDRLKDGITLEGVRYGPIEAHLDKVKEGEAGANIWVTLTLAEGKNREVRRVLEHLGLTVNRLLRLAYGPFALGTLAAGTVEEVGPRVIREQLAGHVAAVNMPKGDRAQYKPPSPSRGGVGGGGKPVKERQPSRHATDLTYAGRSDGKRPPPPAPPLKGEGGKKYKAGWAKPKIRSSGPPKAAGRPAGPGARPGSSSPPRSSPAHPRGPRPGAGPGRRG